MKGNTKANAVAGIRQFTRYPEYKDSGVDWLGEIPEHWKKKRLKFAISLNPTTSEVRRLPTDTEVSFVPMEAVGEYGGLDLSRTRRLADVQTGYTYFCNGDVIVAKITPCFENGKGAYAARLVNGIAFGTTELHVLRPKEMLDRQFLFYLTMSSDFRRLGEAEMYGAGGQKRVPESYVANLRHPLPPLDEQRRIAAFLNSETDKLDELVAKKERLIELLQEKRTALITHAVTKGRSPNVQMKDSEVEWLGEIPEHWEVAPLYARYEVALGKMLDAKRITGAHSGPYLRNVDVQWGHVNVENLPQMDFAPSERDRFLLQPGDLLVCEGGEVGRTAIWQGVIEECFYQKAVHRLRPRANRDQPRYFLYLMHAVAKAGLFVAGGNPNTINHLTATQLRHYRFPFPPETEQARIADFLDQASTEIEALVSKISSGIQFLKEYRTALISAAVTGKIDVREEAA